MMANSVDVLHHSPPVCGLQEEFGLETRALCIWVYFFFFFFGGDEQPVW